MNLKIICISIGILATELLAAQDQTTELSLEQVVKIARLESPDAQTARHSFRSAYWNYKYYRANYLPTLNLNPMLIAAPEYWQTCVSSAEVEKSMSCAEITI